MAVAAGFALSTTGRFSAVHRGKITTGTTGASLIGLANMAHHVDDGSVRIGHEESSDTPRFVREWIHNVQAMRDRTRMNVVDISDFYAHVRKNG